MLEYDRLLALFDLPAYRDARGRNLLHLACNSSSPVLEDETMRLRLIPLLVQLGVSLFEPDTLGRLPAQCVRSHSIAVYSCAASHMLVAWKREHALLHGLASAPCALTQTLPADLVHRIVQCALPSIAYSEAYMHALFQ
jgi:hypothetical protein